MRDLVLNGKNVRQVAVEAFRPEVAAIGAISQLASYSHPRARLAHAAFDDTGDAELAPDHLHFERFALVAESAVPRDHAQTGNLGKVGDNILRNSITEIFLFEIAAHVGEG